MAKYTGPKCRLCRREGMKLFLKGERCYSNKCPVERKGAVAPGQHGMRSGFRLSEYGKHLRAKQKVRRYYNVQERQFKNIFLAAIAVQGSTGLGLLQRLESRLDNVVLRLGFTFSRHTARQLVNHGLILVNGKKMSIPSYTVKADDVIALSPKGVRHAEVKAALKNDAYKVPAWLERKASVGKMVRVPARDEIEKEFDEDLIVEYYSR